MAALQLLSAMCMSASGKFQESAASHEIPSICVTMMSDPSPAVVEEACLCLASFCVIGEEWDREISERSLQVGHYRGVLMIYLRRDIGTVLCVGFLSCTSCGRRCAHSYFIAVRGSW